MAESADSISEVRSVNLDENYNPSTLGSNVHEVEKQKNFDSFIAVTDCLINISASQCPKQNTFNNNMLEMPEISQESCSDEFNLISQVTNNGYEIDSGLIADVTECLTNVTDSVCFDQNISLNNNLIKVPGDSQESVRNEYELISQNTKSALVAVRNSNSEIYDADNKLTDCKPDKLVDLTDIDINLSNDGFGEISSEVNNDNDPQIKDEEFHDAVQFFKDPSSIAFLENAGTTSLTVEPITTRSSLYVNFDPLHAKFSNQLTCKSNDLQLINETETESGSICEDGKVDEFKVVNKTMLNISERESLGNILISFDSPLNVKTVDSHQAEESSVSEKKYTEEELQQALKIQELCHQEVLLKKQQECELEMTKKQQEYEVKINQQNKLCIAFHEILKEFAAMSSDFCQKNRDLLEKNEKLELEIKKLQEELKTSAEDIQSVESTFSDFHKRYEQCKNMLKVYKDNEDSLKQQIENLKATLQEQKQMYTMLQSRTQEMLEKANAEVANAKKSNEGQVAVLNAQLKKAELKISSLESDIKQVKIENSKLGGICDDLMAKVSES